MQAEVPTPPVKANNKRKGNFSDKEDEVLVAAWLHASMDPIVCTEQKSATYWNRIHEEYELHKPEGSDRSVNSLSHRWSVVKEQVGFVLLHCWNMLRFEQKWLAQADRSSQSNKKQKSSSNASPSMSTHETNTVHIDDFEATSPAKADHIKRPIGKKAKKERQRRGKNVTSSDNRALAMEQKKIEIEERKMEMEIMNKDLSSLDDDQKEYYRMLRRDIIDRRSKRSI
ncbi:hypothetical protein BRADI_5g08721v3 [Brachypodium distachyon]|uniref:No apical meristem-associated C-terminal domain-containing protein n=1 Tax=Brachypodium distachyon TaxID=15368 RepID=A0A2K2CG22_BRADI|nr:hypothetical protein BRADI_5g08721v3 [Brachypodium distachyon]